MHHPGLVGRWELATDAVATRPSAALRNVIATSERDFPIIAIVVDVPVDDLLIVVFGFFIKITGCLLLARRSQATTLLSVATKLTVAGNMNTRDSLCNGWYINRYTVPRFQINTCKKHAFSDRRSWLV